MTLRHMATNALSESEEREKSPAYENLSAWKRTVQRHKVMLKHSIF
jgi:hypothetical protein